MNTDMVNAIISGNNTDAREIFNKEIASKVGDALELKRRIHSKTFVTTSPKEETDEV